MLQLNTQAASILARLADVAGLNQVDFIESREDTARRPFNLPMAQLMLHSIVPQGTHPQLLRTHTAWVVLVMAKNMVGTDGLLTIVDQVLDNLSGFQPTGTVYPLNPQKIEFFDRIGEASAYAITFTTQQEAVITRKTI